MNADQCDCCGAPMGIRIRLIEALADAEELTRKLKRSGRSARRYAVRSARLREDRDRWRKIVAEQDCECLTCYGAGDCDTCAARAEIAKEAKP